MKFTGTSIQQKTPRERWFRDGLNFPPVVIAVLFIVHKRDARKGNRKARVLRGAKLRRDSIVGMRRGVKPAENWVRLPFLRLSRVTGRKAMSMMSVSSRLQNFPDGEVDSYFT